MDSQDYRHGVVIEFLIIFKFMNTKIPPILIPNF